MCLIYLGQFHLTALLPPGLLAKNREDRWFARALAVAGPCPFLQSTAVSK